MQTWIAAFFFLTVLRASWACETITLTIPRNETCYSHATFLNPEFYAQFPNGTCIFQRVCGGKLLSKAENKTTTKMSMETCIQLDKKKGKFSMITKKTVTSVKTRDIEWKCPSFEKVSTGQKVLLLRTHGSRKVSPYFYFHKGNASAKHLSVKEADSNRAINFKSPLLGSDKYPSLTQLHVELLDQVGRRKTTVGFRINPNESIKAGRWFAKNRLISSSPWSLNRMRSTKYNYFSIDGVKDVRVTRRFYINVSFGGCSKDRGYMAIIERAYCRWEKRKKYFPSYIWTSSGSSYGRYNYRTYEAAEFRIYGVFKKSPEVYVRKSENC